LRTGGHDRRAVLVAALITCAAALSASRTAGAQATPAAAATSYADLLAVDRAGEGFVARQLREARTFPYLDRGNRLLAAGRKEEARAELAAYLERDPGDVKVRYSYGVLLASLGDARGAEREMTQVLAERPGFGPALLYRANARQQSGDGAGALDDFRAATRSKDLSPADRERALDATARVAVALGRPDVALEALRALDATAPDAERALMQAQLLADAGDRQGAMALLGRVTASSAAPAQRREALSRRSILATAEGQLEQARAAGEAALAFEPNDAALLRQLAEIATKQGDDAAALVYLERAARLQDTPETRRAEVYAAERAGDTARAAEVLRGVLASEPVSGSQAAQDRESLAILESKRGRHAVAADLYLEAFRGGGGEQPALLVSAARERVAAGDRAEAITLYTAALAQRGLPRATRARLAEERGNLQLELGRRTEALQSFTLARDLGRETWGIEQTRGDLLYADGDPTAALAAYQAAQERRDDPRSALGAAYAYTRLGKPGLAVTELQRALAGQPPLAGESRRTALAAAGYLHAQLDQHRAAADAWSAAQQQAFDPALVLPLAREQRLDGDLAAARSTLATLDVATLPAPEQAAYLDERSQLESAAAVVLVPATDAERRAAGLRAAASDLQQAIVLEPSPDREYRLGLLYVALDEPAQAIPPLQRSLATGPFVPSHAATLGYAYQDVGRYEEAGVELARSLDADRDQLSLYEDLGNIRVKEIRNDDAIELFEQAIDNTPLYSVRDEAEREEVDARRLRMRRQVSELSRRFSAVAYTSMCFGSNNCEVGASPLSAGASKSQGGIELSLRPPVIGFRDGRVFELISRVLFEQEVNSIEPRGQTTVITLGVRYKPFPTIDGYLSAERLFGVGSAAQDNVLLRGTYGWQHGYAMQPGVPRWWYTTLYADVARTVQSPQDWFFYTEGRQGMTFNAHADDTMLTPHLYLRGRFQTGDGEDFQEVDLGLGVVLRWLFREDRYHDFQSSAELLPRIGYDAYNSDGRDLTLSLTAVVRF